MTYLTKEYAKTCLIIAVMHTPWACCEIKASKKKTSMPILRAHNVTSSSWLDGVVDRALHRYRRGHGCIGLKIF